MKKKKTKRKRKTRYVRARNAKHKMMQKASHLKLQKEKTDLAWLRSFSSQELEDYGKFFRTTVDPHGEIKIRRILKEKEKESVNQT